MAQTAARHWLHSPARISQESAAKAMSTLAWRGISDFPLTTTTNTSDLQRTRGSTVEVRIGVQQAARELVLESTDSPDAVAKKVAAAMKSDGVLDLVDDKGRRVVVPAAKLAYIEIAASESRRVGFGTL